MSDLKQKIDYAMEAKQSVIQNLRNVKLIIGNGFDLKCKLKTKYSDYFLNDQNKNLILRNWLNCFAGPLETYSNFNSNICNREDFWVGFDCFEKANVWDIAFFLSSYEDKKCEEWQWCDIESKILEWMQGNNKKTGYPKISSFCFPVIYQLLNDTPFYGKVDLNTKYLASFIYKKHNCTKFSNEYEFYIFLLEQLKLFEHNFGNFIYHQQYDDSAKAFGIIKPNIVFAEEAEKTIRKLCNPDKLISIDTFNFGTTCNQRFDKIIHNINGNTARPIFGIDSDVFLASDPRYIFSKTSRRMELDMLNEKLFISKDFENVIVFGSSLNQADYSYFFSVLDKINIFDINNPSKIVFAYSIYDLKQENEIKANLTKAIFQLFQEYSKYKGNEAHPNRLLDSLTAQGKVILYQLD